MSTFKEEEETHQLLVISYGAPRDRALTYVIDLLQPYITGRSPRNKLQSLDLNKGLTLT